MKIIWTIVSIIVGIHIFNWNIEGMGWNGNALQRFNQVLNLPWSLI